MAEKESQLFQLACSLPTCNSDIIREGAIREYGPRVRPIYLGPDDRQLITHACPGRGTEKNSSR